MPTIKNPIIDGKIPVANLPKDPVKRELALQEIARGAARSGPTNDLRTAALHLAHIPWPTVDKYGSDHGTKMAKLAIDVGERLGLPEKELTVIQHAAMLHDLGRTQPWQNADDGHGAHSAAIADEVMRKNPERWGDSALRDDVCRLIALHTLSGPTPTDPRLLALWDADLLESARLAPGTVEGMQVMRTRFSKLATPWAQSVQTQRTWRAFRGWC